jgi:large subunit ribosomal protein L29
MFPRGKTEFRHPKSSHMSKKTDFVKSIHGMNEQDLSARLEEDRQRLKKLEFAHAISPLENPMTIRGLRRDIARLKTELKKRQS